jgi:uncharacterized protein YpmS
MKNLLLAAAFIFSLSVSAKMYTPNNIVIVASQEKEYKKIETTAVTTDVLKQVSAKYVGYSVTEAYVSEDGEYKLVLAKEGKSVKAYYKGNGEFIREEA